MFGRISSEAAVISLLRTSLGLITADTGAHFIMTRPDSVRYGPDVPQMRDKLREMNGVVTRFTRDIDNDTLLVVLGDHGMTSGGDHGGDSASETSTAIFFYAKTGFNVPEGQTFCSKDPASDEGSGSFRTVSQVDIVPTIALSMGFPIPFHNLGWMIPEVLGCKDSMTHAATRENLKQLETLQKAYGQISRGSDPDLETESSYQALAGKARNILQEFEKTWATFDLSMMSLAIVVLGCTVTYEAGNINLLFAEPFTTFLVGVAVLLFTVVFGSDNLILYDGTVTLVVSSTLWLCLSYQLGVPPCSTTISVGALLGLRLYWTCREELGPSCVVLADSNGIALFASLLCGFLAIIRFDGTQKCANYEIATTTLSIIYSLSNLVDGFDLLKLIFFRAIVIISTFTIVKDGIRSTAAIQSMRWVACCVAGRSGLAVFGVIVQVLSNGLLELRGRVNAKHQPAQMIMYALLVYGCIWCCFYGTEHHTNFSSVHWTAGFVGIREFHFWISSGLVLFNTFSSVPIILIALLWEERYETRSMLPPMFRKNHEVNSLTFLLTVLCMAVSTTGMMSVAYLRRHLMMWAVFAPRFLFGVVVSLLIHTLCIASVLSTRTVP